MSGLRKISQFRQLSLDCESPPNSNRRKSLKKQFSEECHDDSWMGAQNIKVSLTSKGRKNLDRPPPVKVAWGEKIETEEAVIVKKCKEVRRPVTAKLVRHSSLEKDSILHSKHELAERIRQNSFNVSKESEKSKEEIATKPNLRIFLSRPTRDEDTSQIDCTNDNQTNTLDHPKLIQPLTSNEKFQIKKSKPKLDLSVSPREKNLTRSNTVVVIPLIETEKEANNEDLKAINNIIIRPVTATSKREQFQKRTNSAFHSTVREITTSNRPPLLRSNSAPSNKEKGKFLATKRKLKAKRTNNNNIKNVTNIENEDSENSNKENPKTQKELNRTCTLIGAEVVTMVSLVSPSGSENEDDQSEDEKEKEKINNLKNIPEKNIAKPPEHKETIQKSLSLRKTVKSVSFQQSSIHAIRSFSASFPARRASMAAAMLLSNETDSKSTNSGAANESRGQGTKSAHARRSLVPDDGERVPKRRLVRSSTVDCSRTTENCEPPKRQNSADDNTQSAGNISIDISSKTEQNVSKEIEIKEPNSSESKINIESNQKPKCDTPKEKQCWDLYCKMTEKGINVSYDTILRGMLTPTEYRMRRKDVHVEIENNIQSSDDNAQETNFQ